jgi:hypothetical protein
VYDLTARCYQVTGELFASIAVEKSPQLLLRWIDARSVMMFVNAVRENGTGVRHDRMRYQVSGVASGSSVFRFTQRTLSQARTTGTVMRQPSFYHLLKREVRQQ